MKVELEIAEAKKIEESLPALYRNEDLIVLFVTDQKGIVIASGGTHNLGSYRADWIDRNDTHWTRLPAGTELFLTQD